MDNTSSLWLADSEDMYCEPSTEEYASDCSYEFLIEDWSGYEVDEDDLFGQLITNDVLYFTSSFRWDRDSDDRWRSCSNGLKLKVYIDGYRKLMPLRKSSDAWRDITDQDIVASMDASIGHISRQLILQQFNDEQRIRSEGMFIYIILCIFLQLI